MTVYLSPAAAGLEYPIPVSGHTVTKHIVAGVKAKNGGRIRLGGVRAPSGWRVSRESLDAFFAALTADRGGASTSVSSEARARRADEVLRATGW